MKKSVRVGIIVLLAAAIVGIFYVLLYGTNIALFNSQGTIAEQERNLILITVALGLIVVIPVFIMLFVIAWKYREGNKKATYEPNWDNNHIIEAIWWGIPCLIIGVLGVIMWQATRNLDPYRPLASNTPPLKVQVVSLQWKWLFLYPDKHVASLNALPLPVNTPIDFSITSDAPMNSFWIPNLSGQIYAMSGMSTQLHIQASNIGEYQGSSANISGEGFADMTFKAQVLSKMDFDNWVNSASHSLEVLDPMSYATLAQPSKGNQPNTYRLGQQNLYDTILMKYMKPEADSQSQPSIPMQGMDMSNMKGMN